ncbi:MAG: hypothetical protein KDA57_06405 [Planctomycetales bacterium]|nr:hypothetical protein [Planctomycetales bacterium]
MAADSRAKNLAVALMGVVILGFCAYGFGSKFIEFVRLVLGDEEVATKGMFAVAPLVNYLLASAGFLCLLGWAAAHGMFHNIEQPKQTMLDLNEQLDDTTDTAHFSNSIMQ